MRRPVDDVTTVESDTLKSEQLLAARGVEQLPDPPIELPGGLDDLRAVFDEGARGD